MTTGSRGCQVWLVLLVWTAAALAQSTQGVLSGRVFERRERKALQGVSVTAVQLDTGQRYAAVTDPEGRYLIPSLSPGRYVVRMTLDPYQGAEVNGLELPVGGRAEITVRLRLAADVYSAGVYAAGFTQEQEAIVHVYAADLAVEKPEPLAPPKSESGPLGVSVSYLVDTGQLRDLPLAGRDTYAMLALLPGITADNPTARGLGLSSMGQRSSATNYLLDGAENNDPLLTGPLTALPPEATQEYRVSTSNYSAEFGRTAGFVANAITRAGGRQWHGLLYGYLNDSALQANSFQHKAGVNTSTFERGNTAVRRQPQTDAQAGFWLGGPVRETLLASAAYERFRNRGSADEMVIPVPVLDWVRRCNPGSVALQYLESTPPPVPRSLPAFTGCDSLAAPYNLRPPLARDRHTALGRLDWLASPSSRLLGRAAFSRLSEPEFISSIYKGLSSELGVRSDNLTATHYWTPSGPLSNEFRAAWRGGEQGWDRPFPDRPNLLDDSFDSVPLPASPAPASFQYRYSTWEFGDTFRYYRGRHALAAGGGGFATRTQSLFDFRSSGIFFFRSLSNFVRDTPSDGQITVRRLDLPGAFNAPSFRRRQDIRQFNVFVQDNWRLTSRLGLNFGIRYDSFGAPRQLDDGDPTIVLGSGTTIDQRIAGARFEDRTGGQRAFRPDRNDFGARFGVYYDLSGTGSTVLRGGYGVFYDRPFDNLTLGLRNNEYELAALGTLTYPKVPLGVPARPGDRRLGLPRAVWVDPNLRTPYTQHWYAAIDRQVTADLAVTLAGHGALGRKLIGTDLVNRRAPGTFTATGLLNAQIPSDIAFRSNFAASSYHALTASARYRASWMQASASYTWSHAIDNQSEPLRGSFDDFDIPRGFNTAPRRGSAALTREFDSRADRASADFDQRHNLVFWLLWTPPNPSSGAWWSALVSDWQASTLAGFRSGFPYDIVAPFGGSGLPACPSSSPAERSELARERPSLLPGRSLELAERQAVPGGYRLLDITALCAPGTGRAGNIGRNSFTGPGFWNIDLSVARSFPMPWLGDAGRLQVRADLFNVLNHANLGNPEGNVLFAGDFGVARLGRQGLQPSFPSLTPLDQLARQIQIQLKLFF